MILITDAAGYIGSHTTAQLVEAGRKVVCLDNFYSGHRWAIPKEAVLVEGDIRDSALVRKTIQEHGITSVIHFAAHIEVEESVSQPLKYYSNNTAGSLSLVLACHEQGVRRLIFSSTAAVYGNPREIPITEDSPLDPVNPYGRSKLMTEYMLKDLSQSSPFRYVALRYFNVAGARADSRLGEAPHVATHLINVACQVVCGKRPHLKVYGTDYPTPDGTCVRDYIHVEDIAWAHLLALKYLEEGGPSCSLNCGYGHGYSVQEVIEAFRKASGAEFKVEKAGRRPGDPATLVANNEKIRKVLGWNPKHDDIGFICKTAYDWEKKLQQLEKS